MGAGLVVENTTADVRELKQRKTDRKAPIRGSAAHTRTFLPLLPSGPDGVQKSCVAQNLTIDALRPDQAAPGILPVGLMSQQAPAMKSGPL